MLFHDLSALFQYKPNLFLCLEELLIQRSYHKTKNIGHTQNSPFS